MTDVVQLGRRLVEDVSYRLERCPKRICILLGEIFIVDTTQAVSIWEHPYYPQYYIPRKEIKCDWKVIAEHPEGFRICQCSAGEDSGPTTVHDVLHLERGPHNNLVRFPFDKMGAWFEEDEQIFVHPKDPYKRIDIRRSSRHIKVDVDGVVVAETSQPILLFETMLRTRYYLPATCVDFTLLTNSDMVTSCPYKGDATYLNVVVKGQETKNAVWRYKFPTQESAPIAGLLCFYQEKVDIWVDGVKESRGTDEGAETS